MDRCKWSCVFVGMALAIGSTIAHAEIATRVYLNGAPTPVYFNDGDSFRVLAGPFKGTRVRTAGFNTLESYGPVHIWGTWSAHELSHFASQGTLNARKGTWHCTSDLSLDGYGRMLWTCLDLAVDQVRKGLAHSMTVTKEGAAPAIQKAQREAINHRRGIWAHGVPEFIMTSLHSGAERSDGTGYNRNVASSDGHSEKYRHTDVYQECQYVCQRTENVDPRRVSDFVATLRGNESIREILESYSDEQLGKLVDEFARTGTIAKYQKESHRWSLDLLFTTHHANGGFSASPEVLACMVYVQFRRRYGSSKATCLR